MRTRIPLLAVSAVLVASFVATPTSLASTLAPDLSLQGRHGSVGKGIISPTAEGERLGVEVPPSRDRYVTVTIENSANHDRTFTLSATVPPAPFAATYDADGQDVTQALTDGTYQPTIRAGRHVSLYVDVTASSDAQTDQTGSIRITGEPASGADTDQVRILLTVPPIRVWASSFDGTIRCEATFPRRTLTPGYATHVSFRLTNLTNHTITAYGPAYLRFKDADGNELWSSAPEGFPGPIYFDSLRPGQTKRVYSFDARIRWSGPLTIVPVCGYGRVHMPRVVLPVEQPDAPPTPADAIAAATAVDGSPFQACPPGPNGEPNTGSFSTPDGANLPPQTLRCWATVTEEDGFDTVSLQLVSPSDAPDYSIPEDLGPFGGQLPGTDNMAAARWDFVVTLDAVRPYLALEQSRALGHGQTAFYELHDGQWSSEGSGGCGYYSYGASFNGEYFLLDWIAGCTQGQGPSMTSPLGTTQTTRLNRHTVLIRRP